MAKKVFKFGNRPISLDLEKADAIASLGGDDYMVTINGNNHRITAPGTNVSDLHGGGTSTRTVTQLQKPADDE